MEFNPLLINRFVRSKSLRKTKTDSIDALMIAQYLMTAEYKPYPPSFYHLDNRGKFSMVDFVELKTLAKNTVASTSDYLLQEMEITIDIYNQLQSKVEKIELQINDCVLGLAPPILSIPGIGVASAAVILSEFGDLSRFKSPSKLLSFAGMEPGYFQSGTMVKHGSSHLRYAIVNCTQTVINNEPTFAAYYAKKRAEGKEHRVALTHVAKKLLRVIYTLQTREMSYNPDLVR